MPTWIELHVPMRDHYKVTRLARELGASYVAALGHLACFWLWAADNARNGDLKKMSDDELAHAARWEGDPQKFVKALMVAGWADRNRAIHDWHEYGVRLLERSRKRMQDVREQLENRACTDSKRERKEDHKQDVFKTPAGFEQFWKLYPRRVGRADALKAWIKIAPSNDLAAAILHAIADQRRWPQWVKDGGQFIPHPATWLHGKRWDDQPPSEAAMVEAGTRPRSVAEELSPAQRARLKALTAQVGKPV